MTSDSAGQLIGIAVFILFVGLVFLLFDRRNENPKATPTKSVRVWSSPPPAQAPPSAPGQKAASAPPPGAANREARFRAAARSKLEPLLSEVIRLAATQGRRAAFQALADDPGLSYRLEIQRPDAPRGLPAPYILLSCGSENDVALQYGGPSLGPQAATELRPGRREISWAQVEDEVRDFSRRALRGAGVTA
jgi:hypothetical protein